MPTADIRDIWKYTQELVDNKSVLSRIGHSATLHSARSAISSPGSFGSKAANLMLTAGKGLLKAIPVPGVPALIEVIADKANEAARKYLHGQNLEAAKAAGDEVNRIKFEIKELTVDEMDRYRWKVTEAMQELNRNISEMGTLPPGAPCCDKYLEIVTACQQAQRRIDKLRVKVGTIRGLMDSIDTWLGDCQSKLTAGKGNITTALADYVKGQNAACTQANNTYLPNLQTQLQTLAQKQQLEERKQQALKAAGVSPSLFSWGKSPLEEARDEVAATQALITEAQKNAGIGAEKYVNTAHATCSSWCAFKTGMPTDDWKDFRNNAAEVTKFLVQFATVAIPLEVAVDKIKEGQKKESSAP